MVRSILSVLSGFVLWTVLWLSSNAALTAALPDAFREDGSTNSTGILVLLLVLSVVYSVIAGYVCEMDRHPYEHSTRCNVGMETEIFGIYGQRGSKALPRVTLDTW